MASQPPHPTPPPVLNWDAGCQQHSRPCEMYPGLGPGPEPAASGALGSRLLGLQPGRCLQGPRQQSHTGLGCHRGDSPPPLVPFRDQPRFLRDTFSFLPL